MDVAVINIGSCDYANYSIPLIRKLCDYNNVNFHVISKDISQNVCNAHPSWLKAFLHDEIDSDFIIAWDADLIPTCYYHFEEYFDKTRLNLGYDAAYSRHNWDYNGKFKYNCGLIGIPKEFSVIFKGLYDKHAAANLYPSWEQYHVNDYIHDNNIEINLLPDVLNYMYDGEIIASNVLNIHYNMWLIRSELERLELIKDHCLNHMV